MSEFECICKCRVLVFSSNKDDAEEKAVMCLEEGTGECEEIECSCTCER